MATQLCQKCKQSHSGRVCDYHERAECAETIGISDVVSPNNWRSKSTFWAGIGVFGPAMAF